MPPRTPALVLLLLSCAGDGGDDDTSSTTTPLTATSVAATSPAPTTGPPSTDPGTTGPDPTTTTTTGADGPPSIASLAPAERILGVVVPSLSDGPHTLVARVYAGPVGAETSRSVTVDNP